MNRHLNFNRRDFLKSSLLGTAALSALTLPVATSAALTKASRDPFHGLKIGIASYSVRKFSLDQAIETTRRLGRDFGLLVGISSGANVWAARQLAKTVRGNIATVLPDRAERYFSTALM